MDRTLFRLTLFLCFSLFSFSVLLGARGSSLAHPFFLKGKVYNAKTKVPIGWATIGLSETGDGVVCSSSGEFSLRIPEPGEYTLVVRSVGYSTYTKRLQLTEEMDFLIPLYPLSIELPEVEVLGAYKKNKSEVVIGQEALQHIQPVSIKDILLLLPGSVMSSPGAGDFKGVAVRQVGQDDNSSLGTAIVIDGTPINNDASRMQMQGLTGQSRFSSFLPDRIVTRRSSLNSGIDLRTLSTNHYDRIEIEQGISSASEGNLSTGAIHLHPKRGVAPLEGRIKFDPLFKLVYVGKGFALGKSGKSSFHSGVDIVDYRSDPREKLERYSRATGQFSYAYHTPLSPQYGFFDFTATLHETTSIQNSRKDELTSEFDEWYRTKYSRTTFTTRTLWSPQWQALSRLSLRCALDYTYDLLDRKYFYLSGRTPAFMPKSRELGLQEGEYLPTSYYSLYQIDNKPLTFYSHLSGESILSLIPSLHQTFLYGVEYSLVKNFGQGTIMNPERPPYPEDNTYIWVRPNYVIPALSHIASYLEDKLYRSWSLFRIDATLGIRVTRMLNLSRSYHLSREFLWDPRLRLSCSYTPPEEDLSISVRMGYGKEHKLPTLDYLYPDYVYRYFSSLNAYYSDPARDHLMTFAIRQDPTNIDLKAMCNAKKELGIDFSFHKYRLSLTLFQEDMNNGYAYSSFYRPIAYPLYQRPKGGKLPPIGKPKKEDFYEDRLQDFTSLMGVENSERIVKRGVEYRLRTPFFKSIRTSFEVNGAYYHTLYTSSIPVMYRPEVIAFGKKIPYVGIYGKGNHQHYHRFNTNLWATTHIPEWGVILTNFFQVIWFTRSYPGREQSPFPYELMDLDGNRRPVDEKKLSQMKDPSSPLHYFNFTFDDLYYKANVKPISVRMSFKGTKQIGDYVRLSFFVDNIIDLSPKYKQKDLTTAREWVIPYFGLEMSLKF